MDDWYCGLNLKFAFSGDGAELPEVLAGPWAGAELLLTNVAGERVRRRLEPWEARVHRRIVTPV